MQEVIKPPGECTHDISNRQLTLSDLKYANPGNDVKMLIDGFGHTEFLRFQLGTQFQEFTTLIYSTHYRRNIAETNVPNKFE